MLQHTTTFQQLRAVSIAGTTRRWAVAAGCHILHIPFYAFLPEYDGGEGVHIRCPTPRTHRIGGNNPLAAKR